jgi:epoxide hydrolase
MSTVSSIRCNTRDDVGMQEFSVRIPAADVADLRLRLARTRWPDQIDGTGWTLGTDSEFLRALCEHWSERFDFEASSPAATATRR